MLLKILNYTFTKKRKIELQFETMGFVQLSAISALKSLSRRCLFTIKKVIKEQRRN